MAKKFAPRVAKKKRKTIELAEKYNNALYNFSDDHLLKGAKLDELRLVDIKVKDQVRTKFNDSSIRELAKNIKENGLIQPLVVHLDKGVYTLICGERRFRAMTSIDLKTAPCFILRDKTNEELMAIQFSENSSREALHYIDKADGILNYHLATKASERKIQTALGISKSEVHRSLLIARMPKNIKEAAKTHNIEKYVLLEYDALEPGSLRSQIEKKVLSGEIRKRSQLKTAIKKGGVLKTGRRKKAAALPHGLSANAFLKAMKSKSKELEIDAKTQAALKTLLEETKNLVDQ